MKPAEAYKVRGTEKLGFKSRAEPPPLRGSAGLAGPGGAGMVNKSPTRRENSDRHGLPSQQAMMRPRDRLIAGM